MHLNVGSTTFFQSIFENVFQGQNLLFQHMIKLLQELIYVFQYQLNHGLVWISCKMGSIAFIWLILLYPLWIYNLGLH
uniref:Uncharacterized protein n=1 Tax=Rhizophora mucronata TaxID=61149 RepID=A0A2P2PCT8_RHIMU